MIRILMYLTALAGLALAAAWLIDHPGEIILTFQNKQYQTSLFVGLLAMLAAMIALGIVWRLLRIVLGLPRFMSFRSQIRRRTKGMAALSRGMVAVGAGDVRAAQRHSADASKHLGKEPLTQLLKAQTAQLSGDRATADATFAEMLEHPDTRLLGLRGLHVEARRRGDSEAAHAHAVEAHRIAGLAWAGQAVVEHRTAIGDWVGALSAVDRNALNRHTDKATANRQRAVLMTAIAMERAERAPDEAVRLAREAVKLAPDLIPAAVLAGRLLARQGELRRAIRVLEAAWRIAPHPDLGQAYLHVRHGDSASDRLGRAKVLLRLAPNDPESRLTVAGAALDARVFDLARECMAPLIERGAPTVRACLTMADIEEVSNGGAGKVREWLARAARAPRDPVWIADGVASDSWAPTSPVTGRLDAFEWRAPKEQLLGRSEGMLAINSRAEAIASAAPPLLASAPQESRREAAPTDVEKVDKRDEGAAPLAPKAMIATSPLVTVSPPQPVVFPAPAAPDDPGPESSEDGSSKQFGFHSR
jgi:HemY protein